MKTTGTGNKFMIDDDDGRKFDNVIIKLFCVQETFTTKKILVPRKPREGADLDN